MAHKYAELMFTGSVKSIQETEGSRNSYAKMEQGEDYNNVMSEKEAEFIMMRDSFYMASVSETGWPYVQHRGGPQGFIKIIDAQTIGFADFRGNKQYISVGNFNKDDRVSLFFMDYKNKRRLKMLGRVAVVDAAETDILEKLTVADYRARVERGLIIKIEAFDWNCPQHITPRYTEAEVMMTTQALQDKIAELEKQLAN
ncbi:MAG: pyridoxamine 5-phosphate oxidase [Kordiimonadaceae bacterium]|jgi:uncharacterized protein|nr:pyridoxamine 5-phosphate oxidase [Kordiimonadaceae bacterium]MBT6034893.1 pyridoxamine 5-phosphate oxidase [Kordiimonadaceae bacterium]MBT6329840.1 pyridoxamine 5-phosphate oxidase [Kordiimonadaceae bacterium]MBT7581769.1 pyridoxamine 5-phosphate oxidase [Kordiimonadaceae bacterium]